MNLNYKIDKEQILKKFKDYVNSHTDRGDRYNSKGKDVQYRSDYVTLEKIKTLYMFVINNIKIDLRRELIHDDKLFFKVMNNLLNRVNNKIRTKTATSLFISVGVENPIVFDGSEDQYEEYFVFNKTKQAQVMRKIIDELNATLTGDVPEEEGKTIINSNDIPKNPSNIVEGMSKEEIADKLIKSINPDYVLEIFKGNFENFDKEYYTFIKEHDIDESIAKEILSNLHNKFSSEEPNNILNKKLEEEEKPKQIYKRFSDPGLENRREKSMDQLKGRGYTSKGGGWYDRRGNFVAKIGDKGEIIWTKDQYDKSDTGGAGAAMGGAPPAAGTPTVGQDGESDEVETGLSDKELEYIRKTFGHNERDDA